jgi:hypothetical protein
MAPKIRGTPEASVVIQLARLHTYDSQGAFHLVDVPVREARHKKKELERQGINVTHTEIV